MILIFVMEENATAKMFNISILRNGIVLEDWRLKYALVPFTTYVPTRNKSLKDSVY